MCRRCHKVRVKRNSKGQLLDKYKQTESARWCHYIAPDILPPHVRDWAIIPRTGHATYLYSFLQSLQCTGWLKEKGNRYIYVFASLVCNASRACNGSADHQFRRFKCRWPRVYCRNLLHLVRRECDHRISADALTVSARTPAKT